MNDAADSKGKLPAFQFYTKDWREDLELQSCSLAAQGLWINAICIAHQARPYGHLVINGKPMAQQQIANAIGVAPRECKRLLDELAAAGVTSVSPDGAIFSRRMVRDQTLRDKRAAGGAAGAEHGAKGASHGAKGGRPRKSQGGDENPPSSGEPTGGEKPPSNPPPAFAFAFPSASPPSGIKGAPGSANTSRAPDEPPDPGTRYGLAAKAMRQQGMGDAHPGDLRLRALVDADISLEQFEAAALEGVGKRKGFAWALTALANRRAELAANPIAAAPIEDWRESREGVAARAEALGLQAWPDYEAEALRRGVPPRFEAWRRRVLEADRAANPQEQTA